MTNYPTSLDNDRTILRIDDNLSELGTAAINQLREAVFAIEKTIGINPQGSKSSLNERISILIGPDGNPRAEALQAVGLATLPISNPQVAANAGIKESKLDLNHSTNELYTRIVTANSQVEGIQNLIAEQNTDFLTHISGGNYLSDGITKARHVASHIDINAVPTDTRDTYTWTGLLDKNGYLRPAGHVAEALLEINNELVGHENSTTVVHPASAVSIDTSQFTQFPATVDTVQDIIAYIDNQETSSIGVDRATLNSNGIPRTARIQDLQRDGYTINVIPLTKVRASLAAPSGLRPNDNITNGDDVISFVPEGTELSAHYFDAKFSHVRVGDIIRINYGNGLEASYPIMSIRFIAGSDWSVRVNAKNLFNIVDGYTGTARIDRPNFDRNTWGVFAAAGVVPNIIPHQASINSVIVASPRGAVAVGINFDPGQIDSMHYNLYLRLYPNGNPEVFYDLPAIDISGNHGSAPGFYNLDIIIENTNKKLRSGGYNYRFIAFNHKGEFGIMLADEYNGAAFSIISGQLNTTTGLLEQGLYTQNVIGDSVDDFDALGLGARRARFATPVMSRTGVSIPYPSAITAANSATLIIYPVSNRNAIVNGNRRDSLQRPRFTEPDGSWNATVSNVTADVPNNTFKVTYTIALDLATEGLVSGKTIVVQPYNTVDTTIKYYGRFIIDEVEFSCGLSGQTTITVLNAIHGTGISNETPLVVGSHVKIYFSDDSVMFNMGHMEGADGTNDPIDYHHYHEVFINSIGKTVAIERARIPHTNDGTAPSMGGEGNIGSLPNWIVRRVSPKFKGYSVGVDNVRYFVYLFVSNYDSFTGEYSVYLSTPDRRFNGPTVIGRKNVPVRVYDHSFVNFIDIEFREDALLPGTTIPIGFVAVELFASTMTNDEYLAIAGVSHNGLLFQSITDLRDFGTTSEDNFTDSAIKFIQAGERYLHTNGVVRGFKYSPYSFSTNPYMLQFSGGMALVNGAFVPVDTTGVAIPVLSSSSNVIEHFICVTETGQLRSIVKSDPAFFDTTHNNFVESLTFADIINNRKDLTVIAKAVVTIDTGNVVVYDARRFVTNQDTGKYSFSYYGYNNENNPDNASFITPDALMCWVNEYYIKEVEVKTIELTNSYCELSFNNLVTLKGGKYFIDNIKGVVFRTGNWKIVDADIYYNPSGSFDDGDNLNVKESWGAILLDQNVLIASASDFGVENSRFYSENVQRPPFVAVYSAVGESYNIFQRGRFVNNTFTDLVADKALCYAFINSNSPDISIATPYFADMLISETKIVCTVAEKTARQGILLAGKAIPNPSGPGYLSANPIKIENFIIKDNRFGYIGYNVDQWIYTSESARFIVDNNKCDLIFSGFTATMHPTYKTFANNTQSTAFTQSISACITNNDCFNLKVEVSSGGYRLQSKIANNIIRRTDSVLLNTFIPDPAPWAMIVEGAGAYPNNVNISDNIIDGLTWDLDGFNGYMHGIYVSGACANIIGNTINNIAGGLGFDKRGWGIWNDGNSNQSTIVGNTLGKMEGQSIGGFIYSLATSVIYGNNLGHFDLNSWSGPSGTDGYGVYEQGNYNGIVGSGAQFAAWNSNQVIKTVPNLASCIPLYHITPSSGTVITVPENEEYLLNGVNLEAGEVLNKGLRKVLFSAGQGWTWLWKGGGVDNNDATIGLIIPLTSILPNHAYLLSMTVTVHFSSFIDIASNGGVGVNTFPEVVLEMNGNVVASVNPTYPAFESSVTLTYHSWAFLHKDRPAGPQVRDAVVKIRQGVVDPHTVKYGGWVGISGSSSQSIRIEQPWITYMF